MPDRKASSKSNSSRTVAKVAVAVLIVIAIAGFLLAGLRSRSPAPGQAEGSDATPEAASSMTGAAASGPAVAEDAAGGPTGVVFAPNSDRLSAGAAAKVQRLAETARKEHRTVSIQAKIEARSDRAEQMALARKRTVAVRQVFEAGGISLGTMQIEISELPAGLVPPAVADRVEVVFR